MRQFIQKWQGLLTAVTLIVITDCLDIVSTACSMAYTHGSQEMNIFMRDPFTLKFVLTKGLFVKGLSHLCMTLPMTAGIYGMTKDQRLSGIPALYYGYLVLPVAVHNFLLAMQG